MSALENLPPKRRAFVEAYCGAAQGNATKAARMAGYAKPNPEGSRLLANASVAEAIAKISAITSNARISTAEERQEWLTAVYRGEVDDVNGPASIRDRMKAVELLGKMRGDFVEKREVEHRGAGLVVALTRDEVRRAARMKEEG